MTTAAILRTPPTPAAIAVVYLTGPAVGPILAHLAPQLETRKAQPETPSARRVALVHNNAPLDDALLLSLAPDAFELHLHGGPAVVQATLQALESLGAAVLPPDSPTAQSLLAARLAADHPAFAGPIAAEMLEALPRATTATALDLLANQRRYGLTAWVQRWTAALQSPSPAVESLAAAAQFLLDRSDFLRFLLRPPRIVLLGPPNAGKSTLLNALAGRPLAITHPTPGTTRDYLTAAATLTAQDAGPSVLVTLVDTAGLRESPDPIEREAVARSFLQAHAADLLLLVLDGSDPHPDLSPLEPLLEAPVPIVLALNKADLAPAVAASPRRLPTVSLSALHHRNLDGLAQALLDQLHLADVAPTEPFAFTPRQRSILQELALAPPAPAALALLDRLTSTSFPPGATLCPCV